MALLESIKIPLGTLMPAFVLKDASGKEYKSESLFGERGLLLLFTCNHCPYANAVWPRIVRLSDYAKGMRLGVAAINPNINPDFPDDSPDKMLEKVLELGISFPYLVDEDQGVAKVYSGHLSF